MTKSRDESDAGESYPVHLVGGHLPRELDDFLGATTVTVRSGDHEASLSGTGVPDDRTVEFIEKDLESANDHGSTWRVLRQDRTRFVVKPTTEVND